MTSLTLNNPPQEQFVRVFSRHFLFAVCLAVGLFVSINAQDNSGISLHNDTLVIDVAHDGEIYAFGKNVVIKKEVKGVFAFGGNVIIEGRVTGDAATLGGSIIQKHGAFVGGDVVVVGGTYSYEDKQPLRAEGKETIMFASYEEELRDLAQNPAKLFSPELSWTFLIHRLLSVLFWFVVSVALTTIAPGAVSRSVARFQLSTLKIVAIGCFGFLMTTFGVIVGLKFLPNYLSAVVSVMTFALVLLAYVFGRVALQVSVGKLLLKKISPRAENSETLAIFIGTVFWTTMLTLPYFWTLALFVLFVSSLGIVLTARAKSSWQNV